MLFKVAGLEFRKFNNECECISSHEQQKAVIFQTPLPEQDV